MKTLKKSQAMLCLCVWLHVAAAVHAEDRAREFINLAWQKVAAGDFCEARGNFALAANIATDFSVKAEAAAWWGFASNRIGAAKVAEEDFSESASAGGLTYNTFGRNPTSKWSAS